MKKLIEKVPMLIKAGYYNEAFKLDNVISRSIEVSDPMKELLRGLSSNHMEVVHDAYKKNIYKAFESGYYQASNANGENVDCCIPLALKEDLTAAFKNKTERFLESQPDYTKIYVLFEKELDDAFKEGIETCCPTKIKEEITVTTAATKKEILENVKRYTELAGNPEAQRVLRYTMGIGDKDLNELLSDSKVAEASKDKTEAKGCSHCGCSTAEEKEKEETVEIENKDVGVAVEDIDETKIGPYEIVSLVDKVKEQLKSHNFTDEELQYIVIDYVVSNFEGTPEDFIKKACEKLEIECNAVTLDDLSTSLLGMEESLTKALNDADLPGELVFISDDAGNFMLVHAFEKEDVEKTKAIANSIKPVTRKYNVQVDVCEAKFGDFNKEMKEIFEKYNEGDGFIEEV